MKAKLITLGIFAVVLIGGTVYLVSRPAEHRPSKFQKRVKAATEHVREVNNLLREVEPLREDEAKELGAARHYEVLTKQALHLAELDLERHDMSALHLEYSAHQHYEKEWKDHLHNVEEDQRRVESLENGR